MPESMILRLTIADPVEGVHYSLQDGSGSPADACIAGREPLSLDVPVTVQPDGRLSGPFVRREGPLRRFVYIGIGKHAGHAGSAWDRRAKVDVHDIPAELRRPGAHVELILPGRGRDGSPACGTVRSLSGWTAI